MKRGGKKKVRPSLTPSRRGGEGKNRGERKKSDPSLSLKKEGKEDKKQP